jgi:hypothetical protein
MGGFSLWHWIIVLFILVIPATIIGLIWLSVRALKRPVTQASASAPITQSPAPAVEFRLQELANLKSKGLITDSEYEQQRLTILRAV